MDKLFIEWFVNEVIKQLEKEKNELESLRRFKGKLVGTHKSDEYKRLRVEVNICECGNLALEHEQLDTFTHCEMCSRTYCAECMETKYYSCCRNCGIINCEDCEDSRDANYNSYSCGDVICYNCGVLRD